MDSRFVFLLVACLLATYGMYLKWVYTGDLARKTARIDPDGVLDYFFMSPDLVYFYYELLDIAQYNFDTFYESEKNMNALLQAVFEVRYASSATPNDVAAQFRRDAMNSLHALVYSTPPAKLLDEKMSVALRRLDDSATAYLREISLFNGCMLPEVPDGITPIPTSFDFFI